MSSKLDYLRDGNFLMWIVYIFSTMRQLFRKSLHGPIEAIDDSVVNEVRLSTW